MELESFHLGRRPGLDAELAALDQSDLTAGRVLAQHRGRWIVAQVGGDAESTEPQVLPARGRLREDPPAVGDWVAIDPAGVIVAVLERHGALMRHAVGAATEAQVLASNVDLALVVEPVPEPNEGRIDRFVALSASASVPAVLLLTKSDLDQDSPAIAEQMMDKFALTASLAISSKQGVGLDDLRTLLKPGATAAVLGPSGAGKSTLVNALLGTERQATGEVRAGDGRGRHVTVTRELVGLPGGSLIIDTPGLREIALWDEPEDLFPEIDRLAAECRFGDCQHESEPGCAVRVAVEPEVLAAWRKLAKDQAALEARKAAAADRKEKSKAQNRRIKAAERADRLE